jgi:cytochrome P450
MGRIIAILGLPFGPQVVQWAVKQEWTGKGAMALVHKLGLGKGFSELGLFLTHMYRVNKISREMLETKLAEAKKLREAGQTDLDSGKIDILSLLAKASLDENSPYKMDQKLLEAQVLTFLGAGHETTASGMAWAMWELANHQDVQAKLRAECQEILSVSAEPTYAQIKDAKYLHNFVMEVMRLRPPTPQTARVASVDSTIGGRFIPRGTEIYIPNLTINTQKDVWGMCSTSATLDKC